VNELARFVDLNAEAFEEADRAGAAEIGQVLGAYISQQQTASWFSQWRDRFINSAPVKFWLNLGNLIGDAPRWIWMPFVSIGGLASGIVGGFRFLNPQPAEWRTPLGTAADRAIEKSAVERPVNRGFGELLKEATASPSATTTTTPPEQPAASQTQPVAPTQAQWWRNVPTQSQHGLEYRGARNEYGCTVTSASMILDYYHAQSPNHQTLSAQELLNVNAQQGEFTSTGMSASNLRDELDKLGYTATDHPNATKTELLEAVKEGPVIAVVKLNLKTTGDNHAVVVTGISDDQVRVNDPWTGAARTYDWDEFGKSWGANFGKDAPINNFVVIRPK
jgi:hypothetical protein